MDQADESGRSSGLNPQTAQSFAESEPQGGGLLPLTADPDLRPIGRCYNELNRLRQLTQQMRALNAELDAASAAFWACRDAATAAVGTAPASQVYSQAVASASKAIGQQLSDIETVINDSIQTTQEVS